MKSLTQSQFTNMGKTNNITTVVVIINNNNSSTVGIKVHCLTHNS